MRALCRDFATRSFSASEKIDDRQGFEAALTLWLLIWSNNADCPGRPTGRKRSSKALRRHRTRRAWLIDELVELGHEVTLFASGDAVEEVARASKLDRGRIRQVFERRFSADRMAENYVVVWPRRLSSVIG
jgi:hypothetical protein